MATIINRIASTPIVAATPSRKGFTYISNTPFFVVSAFHTTQTVCRHGHVDVEFALTTAIHTDVSTENSVHRRMFASAYQARSAQSATFTATAHFQRLLRGLYNAP